MTDFDPLDVLDKSEEAWRPDIDKDHPNPLRGTVVDRGVFEGDYGPATVLTVDDGGPTLWKVFGFGTVLQRRFEELQPRVGERVGAKYVGTRRGQARRVRRLQVRLRPPGASGPRACTRPRVRARHRRQRGRPSARAPRSARATPARPRPGRVLGPSDKQRARGANPGPGKAAAEMSSQTLTGEPAVRAFLDVYTSRLPRDGYLALTRLPRPRSYFPPVAQPDVFVALALAAGTDTYVSVVDFATRPRRGRGKPGDGRYLVGLPIDVDINDGTGVHTGDGLAESVDEALLAISAGLRHLWPTLTWTTGHGAQGVVLLDEPLDLRGADNLAAGRHLMARWALALRDAQEHTGIRFDNVADLARVVRVPGTVNWKGPEPRLVELSPHAGEFMTVADLDRLLPETTAPVRRLHVVPASRAVDAGDELEFDAVAQRRQLVDWADLLEPAGWVLEGEDADGRRWRRPGKLFGCSASTGWSPPDTPPADLLHGVVHQRRAAVTGLVVETEGAGGPRGRRAARGPALHREEDGGATPWMTTTRSTSTCGPRSSCAPASSPTFAPPPSRCSTASTASAWPMATNERCTAWAGAPPTSNSATTVIASSG